MSLSPQQAPEKAAPQVPLGDTNPAMWVALSQEERQARDRYRAFVAEHVSPFADAWDRAGMLPRDLVDRLRANALLGAPIARALGGGGLDPLRYGLLTEELGRGCSSVRTLLTVHDMVSLTLARWASPKLAAQWLPRLAKAEALAALALSEPEVGSDAARVTTTALAVDRGYVLDGRKTWTSFGQWADVFLILAQCENKPTAFLVPADTPGLERQPIDHVVGTRASCLASLELRGCQVPSDCLVGRIGFGFTHVMSTALDHGRFSVAWGSVGLAQACLDACLEYTYARQQGGGPLAGHQLVQRKLTEMIASVHAARLACCRAATLRASGDCGATGETMIAKYLASRAAVRAAGDAVQLHGANGLSEHYPVARLLRDAKVMEIIEGSSQIQQVAIAQMPIPDL